MKIPVWWVPIAFFASSFGSIILSCSTAFARGDAHGFCVVLSGPVYTPSLARSISLPISLPLPLSSPRVSVSVCVCKRLRALVLFSP